MKHDNERLTHLIVEFYEKLSSWEHSVVRDQGLTLPQVHALEILGAHGPMRMKELADRLGVTTGTLTVMADRLEREDFLRRRPNENDRRSILVELTDSGMEAFHQHDALHQQLTAEITARLNTEETLTLERLLGKMISEF